MPSPSHIPDPALAGEALMARIAELELAVGTARDLPTIHRALYAFVASSAPCNGLYVSHYDPQRDCRTCAFAVAEGEEQDVTQLPPMPMTNSPQSRAVRTGEIVISGDFQAAIQGQPVVNLGLERDPRLPQSSLAVPMKVHGRTIGAFEVQSVEPQAYRREHAVLLQMAGNLCAIATENIRLLHEAQASERRFRALIENSADATLALRADLTISYVSPGATRILGYTETEFQGMDPFAIIHPDDHAALRTRLAELLRDPSRMQYASFRCRHRDGTWRWISGSTKNLLTAEGVNALVGNFQDISELKQAETDLRTSEERYRLLFEQNPCMLMVFDVGTRRILAANDAAVRHYGYARQELLTLRLDDLQSENLDAMSGTQNEGGARPGIITRHRRKDGGRFDVEVFTDPLQFFGRDAKLLLCVDISERVQLEEQLRHMQKMESIGQLAGGVAHDFNNILTVIQARTSLLLQFETPRDELRESLQEIHDAALRAAQLTRQLLAFSRKQSLALRSVNLNDVVRNVEAMLRRLVGEDVVLVVHCDPQIGRVDADTGMMEQVLMNLAVNARDAMPDGGRLTLQTSRWQLTADQQHRAPGVPLGAEFVCLGMSDTGTGIRPEHLPRIFDPFFTTKEVGKGTGLGLATVYGIIRQHRGWIDVRSTPGQGAEFSILLPVATPRAAPEKTGAGFPALPRGHETVLVVEDDATVRTMVQSVLRTCGYDVLVASNGREALALWQAKKAKIDLVITDLIMPGGISGADLGAQLQASEPRLRLLYTSGYNPRNAAGAIESISAEFLPKPYDAVTLARHVRQRLDGA